MAVCYPETVCSAVCSVKVQRAVQYAVWIVQCTVFSAVCSVQFLRCVVCKMKCVLHCGWIYVSERHSDPTLRVWQWTCTAMHFTVLYCHSLYSTVIWSNALDFTLMHCPSPYFTVVNRTSLPFTIHYYCSLYYTATHRTSLFYIVRHWRLPYLTALHRTWLLFTVQIYMYCAEYILLKIYIAEHII